MLVLLFLGRRWGGVLFFRNNYTVLHVENFVAFFSMLNFEEPDVRQYVWTALMCTFLSLYHSPSAISRRGGVNTGGTPDDCYGTGVNHRATSSLGCGP